MKKLIISLFIACMFFSFTSMLSGFDGRDYGNDSQRRYKSRDSYRDYKRYKTRKIRRVHRHTYKIPKHIYWKDLRRIRRYQRKIEKYRWKLTYKPMSRYRYMRYVRKIDKYHYKIERILKRYRRHRR